MINQANIKAVITAEDKASGVLRGFATRAESVGHKIGSALKVAAAGAAIAGAAAAAFGVSSVKAFEESQNVLSQLNAVLKSTGGAAGVTKQSVIDLSKQLEHLSGVSDEAVVNSENILLTFTAVGKKIFPDATKAALDMATALNHGMTPSMEDLQARTVLLGKALQDPDAGLGALHRVGVNVDELKKKFTAGMSVQEKQRLILKELNTEFGGSAKAAGQTFAGAINKLKENFNDFQEVVGETIAKRLTPFINKAAQFIAAVDWQKVINRTINAIKSFIVQLDRAWQRVDRLYQQIAKYLGPKLEALWSTIQKDVVPTLKRLGDEIMPLIKRLGPIVGVGLVWAIGEVIDISNALLKAFSKTIDWMDKHRVIIYLVGGAFAALKVQMMLGAAFDAIRVGFATMQLVQIPSLIASLGALRVAFITAFPLMAIAATAVAAFNIIINKAHQTMAVLDSVNQHIGDSQNSTNAALRSARSAYESGKITKSQYVSIFNNAAANADAAVHRASGGAVSAGQSYMVGEQGQEMFVPNQSGKIIPNSKIGTGGNTHINISVNAGAFMGTDIEARKFAKVIMSHLQTIAASKSMSVPQLLGGN